MKGKLWPGQERKGQDRKEKGRAIKKGTGQEIKEAGDMERKVYKAEGKAGTGNVRTVPMYYSTV